MKRRWLIKWILAAVVTIAGGAVWWLRFADRSNLGNTRIGRVTREDLVQRITIAGAVEPVRTTIVAAPYDGYVKKLYVKLGQAVRAGDPVVSLAQSLQAAESVFPIRAPFTGTVTQVLKSEGQFVKMNDAKEFVLRIDDLTKLYINANAPEIDVVKIKPGLEAEIKVSAILGRTYRGVVRDISQAATQREQWGGRAQVDYLMKIEITDADHALKPGMSAVVDIITNRKPKVLTLAHEFIHRDGDAYYVLTLKNKRRDVKLGVQNETASEITEGLTEGQRVRQVDFLKLIESP